MRNRANTYSASPNKGHPLAEVRAEQEASDLKSKLSQIIYQGIVDRLKHGPIHADDLEPLFADEVRDICRRLVPAQLGSLRSRNYIHEIDRRKSTVRSRKCAKSGVYEFTRLGREKLVGVSAGERAPRQGESLSRGRKKPVASADPGEQSAPKDTDVPSPQGTDGAPDLLPSVGVDQHSPTTERTSSHGPVVGENLSLLPEPDPKAWAA